MRKIEKNKVNGEKFLRQASVVLFLLGLFLFSAAPKALAEQLDLCHAANSYPVSRTTAHFFHPETGQAIGTSYYEIWRTGRRQLYGYILIDLPDSSVLKAYLNGTFLADMERFDDTGIGEHWTFFIDPNSTPTVKAGDTLTITKNGEPYLSSRYVRRQYDWGFVGGFVRHTTMFHYACSRARGYIYLPNSIYRRYLLINPRVLTPSPVTRITVNGPSFYPGGIGEEIADVPIVSSTPSIEIPNWIATTANNDSIGLSEAEYQELRQGLLTVNVFTEQHPQGFSQIPIEIFLLNASGDFEGDGQADLAVFRPTDRNWYLLYSSNNQFQSVSFGLPNDRLVIGDYDSDGKTDIAAYQTDNPDYPGLGVWQIRNSSGNNLRRSIQWGLPDDIPIAMDIDRNNTSDLAIFRPSNGTWYIMRMGDIIKPRTLGAPENGVHYRIIQWGMAGDKPLAGDFDADGVDELVAFRPSAGDWYIYNDVTRTYKVVHWGANGDIPMALDFDGDARADLAVYRPSDGTWYIQNSLDNSVTAKQFGTGSDIPVPADFDKDGVTDIAVFRPANGTWYVVHSSDNSFAASQFGLNGDVPAMGQR